MVLAGPHGEALACTRRKPTHSPLSGACFQRPHQGWKFFGACNRSRATRVSHGLYGGGDAATEGRACPDGSPLTPRRATAAPSSLTSRLAPANIRARTLLPSFGIRNADGRPPTAAPALTRSRRT